jgi:hypothetical protein
MPVHDWTRVGAGTWHDFHLLWIVELSKTLNGGLLPEDYYAQGERATGSLGPCAGASLAPSTSEEEAYALKRRTLVVRHSSGDRIVALLESVLPGNKSARHAIRSFVEKAVEALYRGYHLLLVDLFPRGPREPKCIHPLIWGEISDAPFTLPPDLPLTLAAYSAGPRKRAYVESTGVGRELIEMPLFLEPELYVNVPLEATYQRAYRGVPRRWQRVLEAPAS